MIWQGFENISSLQIRVQMYVDIEMYRYVCAHIRSRISNKQSLLIL